MLAQVERQSRTLDREARGQLGSYLVIELHNLWVQYARATFIESCKGSTTESGVAVSAPQCSGMNKDAIVAYAAYLCGKISRSTPRVSWSKEPRWFDLTELFNCFDRAGLPNKTSVDLVQGAGFNVFRELGLVRNFAAHKGEGLASRVGTAWGRFPSGSLEVAEILGAADGTYPTVGHRWVTEMSDACELLAQ